MQQPMTFKETKEALKKCDMSDTYCTKCRYKDEYPNECIKSLHRDIRHILDETYEMADFYSHMTEKLKQELEGLQNG